MTSRLGGRARWLVPVAVLAVVALSIGLGPVVTASATPTLAPIAPAALAAKLARAEAAGVAGTMTLSANLGLPQLPAGDLGGGTSPIALLSGAHTLRMWYADAEHLRLQIFAAVAETDVIRDGPDLWTYSSRTNTVTHTVLAAADGALGIALGPGPAGPLTPQLLAGVVLGALAPSTTVAVGTPVTIAGRPAYTLDISPRSAGSLVRRIEVAVDSETGAPLGLTVFARGYQAPALDVRFTSVSLGEPDAGHFAFHPPTDAPVREQQTPHLSLQGPDAPRIIGSGWDAVLELPHPDIGREFDPVVETADRVDGGRLLRGTLLSVLLTDDGRLYVGAVTPQRVLAAAGLPS